MHSHWQNCPKTAAHFWTLDNGSMNTVSTSLPYPPVSKPGTQQHRQQSQSPSLVVAGFAITAEVLRQPHPVSQSTGLSKLAAADSAHCSADLLNLQDRRLLPQCFADTQTLSGKSFTLDAASNSGENNAHCSAFCSATISWLSKLHTGHIWNNAPFTALHEFLQHYVACREASPATTACILAPQFMWPALRPLLKGMSIMKKYPENTVMLLHPLNLVTSAL